MEGVRGEEGEGWDEGERRGMERGLMGVRSGLGVGRSLGEGRCLAWRCRSWTVKKESKFKSFV